MNLAFLELYKIQGIDAKRGVIFQHITERQAYSDNAQFWGVLLQTLRLAGPGGQVLLDHESLKDGFLAWLDLLKKYDNKGD